MFVERTGLGTLSRWVSLTDESKSDIVRTAFITTIPFRLCLPDQTAPIVEQCPPVIAIDADYDNVNQPYNCMNGRWVSNIIVRTLSIRKYSFSFWLFYSL